MPVNPSPLAGTQPSRRPRSRAIPVLLAVSGWAVLGITAAGAPPPVRAAAVFVFALACPGVALVRLLPLRDFLERAVLSLALGMSLAALAAEAFAVSHILQPTLVLVVLAAICSAAALTELTREAKAT
jgi:hypothetical protein